NYEEYNSGAIRCGYAKEGLLGYIYNTNEAGTVPLYRLWNPQIMDHLYTTNYYEYNAGAASYGYSKEGVTGYIGSIG
ncbi:MAG: hypothetical protein GYA51_01775, partial [Candidatus Methanofastidiosa archaeon]|nr:hypothetical protein [Candidatus Methanofastidiosa archaeon]